MKNKLIVYKGGGYDGCFWEWNAYYVDADGVYHDIYSSGHNGIKEPNENSYQELLDDRYYNPEIIDLDNIKGILYFTKEWNASFVKYVSDILAETYNMDLSFECEDCGQIKDMYEAMPEGYSGDGGIAISAKMLICETCYSDKSCEVCGEYDTDSKYDEITQRMLCDFHYRELMDERFEDCGECGEMNAPDSLCSHCCMKDNNPQLLMDVWELKCKGFTHDAIRRRVIEKQSDGQQHPRLFGGEDEE